MAALLIRIRTDRILLIIIMGSADKIVGRPGSYHRPGFDPDS